MSKTSEFPINVLEIQFSFGNVKTFRTMEMVQKAKFSSEKLFLVHSKKFWQPEN